MNYICPTSQKYKYCKTCDHRMSHKLMTGCKISNTDCPICKSISELRKQKIEKINALN